MKLSVSNIAWSLEYDTEMYEFLAENGIDAVEIAPTRIFPDMPYDNISKAKIFYDELKKNYGITISSMQSIWFGITESVFGSEQDRQKLVDYTKKAVDFAGALDCRNLVFGCPRNRAVPPDMTEDIFLPIAYDFFDRIGGYAALNGTCIAIEPNPPVYNTNFINTSAEAFHICRKLNNPGLKVNMDIGACIYNDESLNIFGENMDLINHIHISEPGLTPIKEKPLHKELIKELKRLNYDKFLSVEMANPKNIGLVKEILMYIVNISNITTQ